MRTNGLLSLSGLSRICILTLLLVNIGCIAPNGWTMNRSGMRQYQRGHYVQARHRFARAVAQDPCNADYRHNLAMAIQKQGDPVACEKILRHNLTINAMHQPTYHSLAQLMVTQGRAPEAQDLLAGWVATQPYVPEANVEMAWLQKETGDTAGAEQSLQQALKTKPTHAIALAQLGQLYQSTGRNDQAVTYYQRSLAANWDQPEVQSRLATLTDPPPRSRSRSAMMQNSGATPMMASNPAMMSEGLMVSTPMMMGDPMMADASFVPADPMMANVQAMQQPIVATGVPFGNDPEAIALEDINSNPAPKRRSRKSGKDRDQVLTAYPLPTYDGPSMAWVPSGTISGQPSMAFQPPAIGMDQTAMAQFGPPQIADSQYLPTPLNNSAQTLVPQADPAHFYGSSQEMTATLPVVEPR